MVYQHIRGVHGSRSCARNKRHPSLYRSIFLIDTVGEIIERVTYYRFLTIIECKDGLATVWFLSSSFIDCRCRHGFEAGTPAGTE